MQFTPEQQKTIDARNPQVLVSAAAGSGKTTVLIARVLSLMKEGIPVDKMRIVTFSRASAAEMRSRLIRELDSSSDPVLRDQAMLVNRADICTIHVLCSRLIRRFFHAAGIDPMSRVAEQHQLEPLYERAYDQVLESVCADPEPDDRRLLDSFSFPEIRDMSDECRRFMQAAADPDKWTENALCRENFDRFFDEMDREALFLVQKMKGELEEMRRLLYVQNGPLGYEKTFVSDEELVKRLEASILSGGPYSGLSVKDFVRLSGVSKNDQTDETLQERYKTLRNDLKSDFETVLLSLPTDPDAANRDILFTMPAFSALVRLTQKTNILYSRFKREKNYLDYGDLEHLALKVLTDDRIAAAVCRDTRAVFVDECQDISELQEAILSRLVTPDTLYFMVGDVKQSIYRFRLAEPTLFQQKYRDFSFDSQAERRKIILQNNFRSTKNILNCVNRVFSFAMHESSTELEYDHEAELKPKEDAKQGAECELTLFTEDGTGDSSDNTDPFSPGSDIPDENGDPDESSGSGELSFGYKYEAAYIAKKIHELIRTGVPDGQGGIEQIRYRDIVILIRNASGRAPVIAKILSASGIPVYSDADKQFYDLPEISDVLSILRVLDNPYRDIPLLAALHCPCFSFTNRELALIRLHSPHDTPYYTLLLRHSGDDSPLGQKIRETLAILERWRFLSGQKPVESLLYLILRESGLYQRAGTLEDGDLRQADMRLLCEQAASSENPCDLHAFLQSVESVRVSDDEKAAKAIGENEDVVRIMTMHKSKGLEFEVVFITETARNFRKPSGNALFDPVLGGAIRYIDPDERIRKEVKHETFAYRAVLAKKRREQVAEECRLLYVALTRAKKKLFILGSPKKNQFPKNLICPPSEYSAGTVRNMLDWICLSLNGCFSEERETVLSLGKGGNWIIRRQPVSELEPRYDQNRFSFEPDDTPVSEEILYYMQRTAASLSPLKLSVSSVVKELKSEEDMEETPADKRSLPEPKIKPDFLMERRGLTAAEKGTAAHKCLGCIDHDLIRSDGTDEAFRMLAARGILSDTEYHSVDPDMIRRFFASSLGQRVLASSLVNREWPFNLLIRENVLLQGVIDLCFIENGEWILADYKTDRCPIEELVSRYSVQLNLYRIAVEKITGIPVRETLLFSLQNGQTAQVPRSDPDVDKLSHML